MLNLICKNCNKHFEVPNKQKNRKFCCHNCYVQYGIENKKIGRSKDLNCWEFRECVECHNLFEVRKKIEKKLCSDECRNIWNNREENKENRKNKSQEKLLEKYGVNSVFKLESYRKEIKEKNIQKYGFEFPSQNEEIRKILSTKVKDAIKNNKEKIINDRRLTSLIRYGDENYNNRKKFNETLNERYGGHHLKLKEFIEKQKNTFIQKYGVNSSFNLPSSREKNRQVVLDKYGETIYTKSKHYKNKMIEKRIKKVLDRIELYNLEIVNHDIENKKGAELKCKVCNNLFYHTQLYCNNTIKCPKCYPVRSNNTLNIYIESIFDSNEITYVKNSKNIIHPFELDYFVPEKNIAFELNGNYYHSEIHGGKTKEYHINKTKMCDEKGIKLIHIYEDEINNNENLVKSKILSLLGHSPNKIYARKTIVKNLSGQDTSKFLNENHIQGNINSKVKIGLFHNDELVFLCTFSKPRMDKKINNTYELYRSCSKQFTNVVGGFGKCLKYFIEHYNPDRIISYADIRWSGFNPINSVYDKVGFDFVNTTSPNYWYISNKNFMKRHHRYTFRKNVLVENGEDPLKTEWEIMMNNGYDRIWDCGSLKFELIIK